MWPQIWWIFEWGMFTLNLQTLVLSALEPIVAMLLPKCPSAPLSAKNISFSMNLNIYEYFSISILFRNSIILIWICINWGGRMHTKTILQDAGFWYENALQCMNERQILERESKSRSEEMKNPPFCRINSGPDFRPLCQDSHRTHHRGPCTKRNVMACNRCLCYCWLIICKLICLCTCI